MANIFSLLRTHLFKTTRLLGRARSFEKVSAEERKYIRHVSSVVEGESRSDAGCIWQKLQGKEMTEKNKNTSKYSLHHYILIAN